MGETLRHREAGSAYAWNGSGEGRWCESTAWHRLETSQSARSCKKPAYDWRACNSCECYCYWLERLSDKELANRGLLDGCRGRMCVGEVWHVQWLQQAKTCKAIAIDCVCTEHDCMATEQRHSRDLQVQGLLTCSWLTERACFVGRLPWRVSSGLFEKAGPFVLI